MRVLRVEFTWQVPFKGKDGKWDHRRIFEARDFDLWWHRRAGGVLINGVFVHAHQAAIEVDGCAACEMREGHAEGCPLAPGAQEPPPAPPTMEARVQAFIAARAGTRWRTPDGFEGTVLQEHHRNKHKLEVVLTNADGQVCACPVELLVPWTPPVEVTDGAADPGPPGAPAGRKGARKKS